MKKTLLTKHLFVPIFCLSLFLVGISSGFSQPVRNLNTSTNYSTIQAAINAASTVNGHVIRVYAGTFAEHVTITKELTLRGANFGTDGNAARVAESVVDATLNGNAFRVMANNVTINGFRIINADETNGAAGVYMSATHGNTRVVNNIITNNSIGVYANCNSASEINNNLFDANNLAGPSGGTAIYAEATVGLTVRNNEIKGHTDNNPVLFAALLPTSHTNTTFERNNLHDNVYGIYAISLNTASFTQNTINVTNATCLSLASACSNVTVANNFFVGALRGVRLTDDGYGYGNNSNVTVNNNSFSIAYTLPGTDVYAVGNISGYVGTLNAECNWYGTTSPAAVDSANQGNVDYSPWLVSGTDNTPGTPGFQPAANTCTGTDTDADDVLDSQDNCRGVFNPGQENRFGYPVGGPVDAEGDACDDTDSDGYTDAADFCPLKAQGPNEPNRDRDNDGVGDDCDNCRFVPNADQANNDGNGGGDACDADDDNDNVIDDDDNCDFVSNPNQNDQDGDGLGNPCDDDRDGDGDLNVNDNCPTVPNPNQENVLGGTSAGDACEDQDGDGDIDNADNCPVVSNPNQENNFPGTGGDACGDSDSDGDIDNVDNCPINANGDQANNDNDTQGDVCDTDDDNDLDLDVADNCQFNVNPDQANNDGDSLGDVCDDDDDNDGDLDVADNCQFAENPGQEDNDGDSDTDGSDTDGGDACDDDDDNDGVDDLGGEGEDDDNCPFDSNPEQFDIDGDGEGDECEEDDDTDEDGVFNFEDNCPNSPGAGASQLDTDRDGAGDVCDEDDDADGIEDWRDCFSKDGTPAGRRYIMCRRGSQICVTANERQKRLDNGWRDGACGNNNNNNNTAAAPGVTVEEVVSAQSKVGVSIYPNPTSGAIKVQLQNFKAAKAEILIMSANGSVVERRSVSVGGATQTEMFDLTRKAAGIYLVRIVSEEGVRTSKIVLQR